MTIGLQVSKRPKQLIATELSSILKVGITINWPLALILLVLIYLGINDRLSSRENEQPL